ncbi:MAG: hypothetical protein ACPGVU_01090 [Limisphaerales bacterium]
MVRMFDINEGKDNPFEMGGQITSGLMDVASAAIEGLATVLAFIAATLGAISS